MKILGNTPEGDLIIQVSQAEWDGLQDGTRPKDDGLEKWERWQKTEASMFLANATKPALGGLTFRRAFEDEKIDGSIQSLRDVASGKIKISNLRIKTLTALKKLLDEQSQ